MIIIHIVNTGSVVNKYVSCGDPTAALARNFEMPIEEQSLACRGTFVIDPEGKIK